MVSLSKLSPMLITCPDPRFFRRSRRFLANMGVRKLKKNIKIRVLGCGSCKNGACAFKISNLECVCDIKVWQTFLSPKCEHSFGVNILVVEVFRPSCFICLTGEPSMIMLYCYHQDLILDDMRQKSQSNRELRCGTFTSQTSRYCSSSM